MSGVYYVFYELFARSIFPDVDLMEVELTTPYYILLDFLSLFYTFASILLPVMIVVGIFKYLWRKFVNDVQ